MTSPQQPPTPHRQLEDLGIAAPPWWDAWEAWQARRDPHPDRFIEEKDPREHLNDELAYELAVLAFGDAWESLLADLATHRSPLTMSQRVLRLREELARFRGRIRGK